MASCHELGLRLLLSGYSKYSSSPLFSAGRMETPTPGTLYTHTIG